ncbi:hypothetical protein [Sphingomonas xanthus]|uniref:Sulfotransferase domain-containing protein n=1 Tax=Sphingomonas xanthus TaxID=2594473 RepID=A0A516IR25_9SPHN|nr:hypothetical protein [Sphingomonas xanthus]QDP19355.1 hypothetical protein FMM02_04865 [Sphingomonas xanthus]
MPVVSLPPDTLNRETNRFEQVPLRQPLFLNSVQKSGSHLLRNIIRMFVPVEQQYQKQFVQWGNMPEHLDAWDAERNLLSWGHLFFSDASAIELAHVRKILLVRDPYDWVLARARFFMSENFQDNLDMIKDGKLSVDDLLSLMIFGIHGKSPPLADIFRFNAAAWLGSDVFLVRFEELKAACADLNSDASQAYFRALLSACGIDPVPADWRERVMIGSDRKLSGTARENLTGAIELPEELPARHKALVDYAAPGLRRLLGYSE